MCIRNNMHIKLIDISGIEPDIAEKLIDAGGKHLGEALQKIDTSINFDVINSISYSKKERQIILRIIVQYYELHLEGFRKPKSLDILETVFN